MDKKIMTVSIRVTPEERDRILQLARWEDRNMSDSLHRLIFGRGGEESQGLLCKLGKHKEVA